jgi:rhamnosyl/mannosyltransferase
VGDGPLRAELEALARSLGISGRVHFAGRVAPASVAGYLDGADLFILPARHEGLGLAAIEALLAGVPILVCRDGGGLLDVLEVEGAGRAVEPTAAALAAGIDATLDDPESRPRAHQAGRVWAARLEPEQVAERCERWYAEAIRARR